MTKRHAIFFNIPRRNQNAVKYQAFSHHTLFQKKNNLEKLSQNLSSAASGDDTLENMEWQGKPTSTHRNKLVWW